MISARNYSITPAFFGWIADEIIEPTFTTPFVKYDQRSNYLVIKGTSTRENIRNFYNKALGEFKMNVCTKKVGLLHLIFKTFNTSTAKVLFDLFRFLSDAREQGARIAIQWDVYGAEEDMIEMAQDFAELFEMTISIK